METDPVLQNQTGDEISQLMDWFAAVSARLTDPPADDMAQIEAAMEGILPSSCVPLANTPATLFRTSKILYTNEAPTMGQLGQALEIPLYTATRMVDWWVNNGLAQRLPDPSDRRVVRITLTENGRRFHEVMQEFSTRNGERILSCLTNDQRDTFIMLFGKIASNLK